MILTSSNTPPTRRVYCYTWVATEPSLSAKRARTKIIIGRLLLPHDKKRWVEVLLSRHENGHPAILSGVYGEEKPGRVPQKNSCVVSFVILVEVVGFCESCNPPVLGWTHETTNLVGFIANRLGSTGA